MILVISDVHLGYNISKDHRCNRKDFQAFLESYTGTKIDHLVLLGDFFDFWRSNNARIIEDHEEIMAQLTDLNADKMHYIAGNHDYYILDLIKRYEVNEKITFSKYLRLKDNNKSFFFIHGYEIESILTEFPTSLEVYESLSKQMCYNNDTTGSIESRIWAFFEGVKRFSKRRYKEYMNKQPTDRDLGAVEKFALTTGKYPLLGMEPNEYLVFGHTHRPFINEDKNVVNTGSWINDIEEGYQKNSYVEIDNGKVNLSYF